MTLRVVHILSIFHDESLYSFSVLSTKKVLSTNFKNGISFHLTRHLLLVLHTIGCHYRSEIATVESRGTELTSAEASVLFRNVAIIGGTSATYFLKAVNTLLLLPLHVNIFTTLIYHWKYF